MSMGKTGAAICRIALRASGGCGFVATTKDGYFAMQQRRIDFQVVDRNHNFPKGCMTHRLKGMHVNDPAFLHAVQDFSAHTATDKWHMGPARGLSKDGYILVGLRGEAYKGAVRLAGMPTPP